MYEVYISAREPWTAGVRAGVQEAVLTFCEANTPEVNAAYTSGFGYDDADEQLRSWLGDAYAGYGADAHPDAEQYVFNDLETAERFQSELRHILRHILRPLGAIVGMAELDEA